MNSCFKVCRYILILYFSAYSFAAFSQLDEAYIIRNNVSHCLNVRSVPDADAPAIACLAAGTEITVIDVVPFWRQIKFDGSKIGWVAKKFIEPIQPALKSDSNEIPIPSNAYLTVHFIDVGQGDAIWIQTYDDGIDGNGKFEGYSIVIDGGPYSADDSNPLLSYMESEAYHNADVEALVVTHPHTDHFSGAETISRHFSINNYYDPGYPSTLSSYTAFLNAIKGNGNTAPRAKHLHIGKQNFGEINWGKELKVDVLYAWNGNLLHTLGADNTLVNNSSIVLRVQYGNYIFLFMGDAEGKKRNDSPDSAQYVEQILLQSERAELKANVLKIAHHGSETSSTIPFINAVDPDIVIVESGRKNFNGTYLPDSSTLQRFCNHNPNIKIYRTDQGDAVTAHSDRDAVDGDNIIIRTNGKDQPQVQGVPGKQTIYR